MDKIFKWDIQRSHVYTDNTTICEHGKNLERFMDTVIKNHNCVGLFTTQ